jgi:predicted nucleic acid-binding protein
MRVVLDADVLVSAAISEGPSHRIVRSLAHREVFWHLFGGT